MDRKGSKDGRLDRAGIGTAGGASGGTPGRHSPWVRRIGCVAASVAVMALAFAAHGDDNGPQLVRKERTPPEWDPQYPDNLPSVLSLTAPKTGKVGGAINGINIRLVNLANKLPDARLRLLIHGDGEHEVGPDAIKLEIQESGGWKPLPTELIDEGVMAAIGAEGEGHKDRHKSGGFAIDPGLNKVWKLRMTFNTPGSYQVVAAISDDNGRTHLAQPQHTDIEVK
jgi:hypothetical protein